MTSAKPDWRFIPLDIGRGVGISIELKSLYYIFLSSNINAAQRQRYVILRHGYALQVRCIVRFRFRALGATTLASHRTAWSAEPKCI